MQINRERERGYTLRAFSIISTPLFSSSFLVCRSLRILVAYKIATPPPAEIVNHWCSDERPSSFSGDLDMSYRKKNGV